MSADQPFVLLVEDLHEHGVVQYARALADGVMKRMPGAVVAPTADAIPSGSQVHAHFTDRLWGTSPAEAAERFERLAERTRMGVTLHDVPQPSDGTGLLARRDAYARVCAAACSVVVNSEHELGLLLSEGVASAATVIPLPVDRMPLADRPETAAEAAILGFVYPGKGHRELVEAVAAAGAPVGVVALGRASPGHDGDVDRLRELAAASGVPFEVTGYLPDAELIERCRAAAVPVIAHRHFSASASLNTWIAAGRRPIVVDGEYAAEVARLRPGTVRLVDLTELPAAIDEAVADPATTWLADDAVTAPGIAETVDAYLAVWSQR